MPGQPQHYFFNKNKVHITSRLFLTLKQGRGLFLFLCFGNRNLFWYHDFLVGWEKCIVKNEKCIIFPESRYINLNTALATEIYKFQASLTPPIMSDLFVTRENNYNLRNFQELKSSLKRTVKFATETICYIQHRGPKIWNLIPERLRELETLNKSKKEMKNGSVMPVHVARMCKTYIQHVGFIIY